MIIICVGVCAVVVTDLGDAILAAGQPSPPCPAGPSTDPVPPSWHVRAVRWRQRC